MEHLFKIQFNYQQDVTRKYCRKPETYDLRGSETVCIREVDAAQAPVAYRVRPINPGWAYYSFDVRILDDHFWWPVSCRSGALTPELLRSFVAENDYPIIGSLGAPSRHCSALPTRDEFAQKNAIRGFGTSTHDEVMARLHRGASRTMFCDNQVYFQAGPPAFFRSQTRSEMFVGASSLCGDDYGNDGFESIQIPGPSRYQRRQIASSGEAVGPEELSAEIKRLPGWSVLPDVHQKNPDSPQPSTIRHHCDLQ